jgi:phage terminase large subunit GpA-like protein
VQVLSSDTGTGFADPGALVVAALKGFLPHDLLPVDEYCEAHRKMADAAGRYVKPLDLARTPYLRAPMQALTDPDYHTVVIPGPGQSGKTVIAEGWMQQTVGCDPGPMLWYLPTDPLRDAYVKERINPLIFGHEHDLLAKLGTGQTDNSLRYKRFGAMSLQFLSATESNLINKTARKIVGDEVDAYDRALGDVKVLFDVRRQTYGDDSMLLLLSHPDLAIGLDPEGWNAGIMAVYKDSVRGTWWWPCPRCGAHCSPNPGTLRPMLLSYEDGRGVSLDDVQASAHLRCPVCGGEVADSERPAMNAEGFWSYLGEEVSREGRVTGRRVSRRIYGAWIVGIMSPFLMEGIGGLARALVKARRESDDSGDDRTVRAVVAKQQGHPYTPPKRKTGTLDANALAERCEDYRLGTVPPGVLTLFAAADTQVWGWDVLVRGFGLGRESWVIDSFQIRDQDEDGTDRIVPAVYAEHWQLLVDRVMRRSYPLADGSGRRMLLRCFVYDTGGVDGVAEKARDAWQAWRKQQFVRDCGTGAYGDLFTAIPYKGMSRMSAAKLAIVWPDGRRRVDRPSAWWGAPLAEANPNLFKSEINTQLRRTEPGPGYVHFPIDVRNIAGPPHPFFEELVAEGERADGTWTPVGTARSEKLDLMVMTAVGARAWNMHRLDINCLPTWAAPWDRNALVQMMTEDGEVLTPSASANAVRPPARRMLSRGIR